MPDTSSTTIIIFGASGDLTQRKLIPALYNLFRKERLPENTRIVGASRSEFSHDEFRDKIKAGVQEFSQETFVAAIWERFAPLVLYKSTNLKDEADFAAMDKFVGEWESDSEACNRLYYLSIAPSLYTSAIANLGENGMANERNGWRRVVIEKPFGYDLQSAQALNEAVHAVLHENQVYRIDHYLGKETAQNILFLRFANTIFEPIWNRTFIDNVQITVTETVDVGHRADYYDSSGVLRDMFQNHLMQLLALVAMEPPSSLDADPLRNEKIKVLQSVRPIALSDTVRAQYRGYRDAKGVAENSQTPTYAAIKLHIDNWRWQGVPFYLRSGKALKQKATEINIVFRQPPMNLFDVLGNDREAPNILSLCIQPDEGIHLKFEAKLPDTREGRAVDMTFHYDTAFGQTIIPEAYERLIFDALLGDASLFTRSDSIEAAWRLIDTIIDGWQNSSHALPLVTYSLGSWGPVEADDLLDLDGHAWYMGCIH